jgi:hypothetical protein
MLFCHPHSHIQAGHPYDAKGVKLSVNSTKPKQKKVQVLRLQGTLGGKNSYYTIICAVPPPEWGVGNLEVVPVGLHYHLCIQLSDKCQYWDAISSRVAWSDFRENTSKTTIGIGSFHLNSVNYNTLAKVSQAKGRRKKVCICSGYMSHTEMAHRPLILKRVDGVTAVN